jgi:3-hydroxybutyrate dehydrogenase
VLTPLVHKQINDRSGCEGISVTQAQNDLLGEKQSSLQFTTVEQLGGLAAFLCSPAADQVRGVAWQVDGGWTAQ